MSKIWIIAKMSVLENSRKQVFHVLCLVILTIIVGSTLLSLFTEGTKIKILKDLCMTSILFGGAILSIALGATGIPNDVESRTIYPLIARPMSRIQYVLGKYLGAFLTASMAVSVMAIVFAGLIAMYQQSVDSFLLVAMLFSLLEVAVICAVSVALSTFATPAISVVISFLIYVFGSIKISYLSTLIQNSPSSTSRALLNSIYHILPNLECFNLKNALVHQNAIPASYLLTVAAYAVLYSALVLMLSSAYFTRKEV